MKHYRLATQRQLQNNTILGADNQPIAMETIPDFHCQENSPCYRLDNKTGEEIYYTFVDNDENSYREIRLNHQRAFYFYLDENNKIQVSITTDNASCLAGGEQCICQWHFSGNETRALDIQASPQARRNNTHSALQGRL